MFSTQHNLKVGSPLRINRFSGFSALHSSSTSRPKSPSAGRFIPTELPSSDLYSLFLKDFPEDTKPSASSQRTHNSMHYSSLLESRLGVKNDDKMLKFGQNSKPPTLKKDVSPGKGLFSEDEESEMPIAERKIAKNPYKKLDAPGIRDDFYLNLVDWSSQNFLSVGLDRKLYIWSAYTNKSHSLCELESSNYIGCVSWRENGDWIAMGDDYGDIHLFDLEKKHLVTKIKRHSLRIGSLAWNGNLLASGSRDKKVIITDLRSPNPVFSITSHRQEICGLKWSFDSTILASGGNDNRVNLFSLKLGKELIKLTSHTAAVKALAWSPHERNILLTGGGTSDRTIRVWDVNALREIDCIDTGSQVCNLLFSKNTNELVSTHGYSLNHINVWRFPKFEKLAALSGHTMRVLYLAGSPEGENIVTGAGDETLRFWNIFPGNERKSLRVLSHRFDLR